MSVHPAVSEASAAPAAPLPEATPEPAAIPAPAATPVRARPFDRRHAALTIIAILAILFALRSAREFVIPLILAVILSYALEPVVAFLGRRLRVPRVLSAPLVILALIGIVIYGASALQNQVGSIVEALPQTAQKVARSVESFTREHGSLLDKLRSSASALGGPEKPGGARVVVQGSSDRLDSVLLAGSMGVATLLGQAAMVLFLVFFLLLSGDIFKRKFIKVCGHTLSEKKISVHMLDQINRSIRLYMAMMVITNVVLALVTWAAFRWIGLENAGTWAVVAGALHVVPYFGPLLVAVLTGLAAVVQFGELGPGLLTAGTSLLIAVLIGFVVQTWMTGRIARMNPVAVFVALLLFSWIWGIWGTLLSIPIAVIAKVVADHIEGLEGLAEFLGE